MRPREALHLKARAGRTEDEFEAWVTHVTERADPLMAWLGVVFALLIGFELAVPLGLRTALALSTAGWVIWALFVLEFLTKMWLAPRRASFARRHWAQALILLLPFLRVLSFLRLLRLGRALPATRVLSSSYRNAGTARRLVGSRLGYLAALSAVFAIAVAELAFIFERGAATFRSFADALLWSLAVVLAGQGDPVPQTVGGRLVMITGFAFSAVVVAALAGAIGAFLIEDRRERAEAER